MSKLLLLLTFALIAPFASSSLHASNYQITYEDFTQLSEKDQLALIEKIQSLAVAMEARVPAEKSASKSTYNSKEQLERRFVFLMGLLMSQAHAQDTPVVEEPAVAETPATEEAVVAEIPATVEEPAIEETPVVDNDPNSGRWDDYLSGLSSADKAKTCMFAGWISLMNDAGTSCRHPTNVNNSALGKKIKAAYKAQSAHHAKEKGSECKDKGGVQIVCHPAVFGNFAACVKSSGNHSRNSSLACFGKYKSASSDEKKKLLQKIIDDPNKSAYFVQILHSAYQMCACNQGVSTKYSKWMYYHRTCFGLMKQTQDILADVKFDNTCRVKLNGSDADMPLNTVVDQIQKRVNDNVEARLASAASGTNPYVADGEEGREKFEDVAIQKYVDMKQGTRRYESESLYKQYYDSNASQIGSYTGSPPPKGDACAITEPDKPCEISVTAMKQEDGSFKALATVSDEKVTEPKIKWTPDPTAGEGASHDGLEATFKDLKAGDKITATLVVGDSEVTCALGEYEIKEDCEISVVVTPKDGGGHTATATVPDTEGAEVKWEPTPTEGDDHKGLTANYAKDKLKKDDEVKATLVGPEGQSCTEGTGTVKNRSECEMTVSSTRKDGKFELKVDKIKFTDGTSKEGDEINVRWTKKVVAKEDKTVIDDNTKEEVEIKKGNVTYSPLTGSKDDGYKEDSYKGSIPAKDTEIRIEYKEGDQECNYAHTIKGKKASKANYIPTNPMGQGGGATRAVRRSGGNMFGTGQ